MEPGSFVLYRNPNSDRSGRSRKTAGTEGAISPFFSLDGGWVGFFADGKIKRFRWKAAQRSHYAMRPPRGVQAGATTALSSRRSLVPDSGVCLRPAERPCQ